MNIQAQIELDEKGWILGPEESLEEHQKRIERLDRFFSYPPEDVDHFLTDPQQMGAKERLASLFDLQPDWVVCHFSNQSLTAFQGGATWIVPKEGGNIPLIQLKKSLDEGRLTKFYQLDEILAHEMVHAVRMEFDEPHFEEILAYSTSKNLFRRFFGPLFERTFEAGILLSLAVFSFGMNMASLIWEFSGNWIYLSHLVWLYLAVLVGRLTFFQVAFFRAKAHLKEEKKPLAPLLRLTDKEILKLAFYPKSRLCLWLKSRNGDRWNRLKKKYPSLKGA